MTGNETWLYFFEPDCKENNKVWVGENGARPKIARRNKTSRRVMYALFFDCDGIVARVPVPEKTSVTGKFYKENVLSAVVNYYVTTRPQTGVRGLHILHDNVSARRSAVVLEYLEEMKIKALPHPAYSPDLSPCIGLTLTSNLAYEDAVSRAALPWEVRYFSV